MGSLEIINVYERLAGLTAQMAEAALARNWGDFETLENQCAKQVEYVKTLKKTPLTGEPLRRKIRLLKEIMAHDRNIREMTEPWQQQLPSVMRH
ncbi:flagellar protein FliT [Oxalobacter vibrioformis]|uniref:Flagellar protein FliT n=1 Tax=Oxalobacter vibrioformis TaxID=933080 RepID=A0A9E9LXP7_9BURK|nr:flagellar protein FliT [Oxalobacter vibrioformis]WAW09339.1 flagellar protein FliT [Oxalobacter vibrioformis]